MDISRFRQAIRAGAVDPTFAALYHKDSPSPPPAPDYAGAAQAQGAANVETARAQARANNPNVVTPYGTQTVTWGNYDNDQPQIVQTLAPAQQQLLDSQNRISNNLAGVAESGLNRVSQGMNTPFNINGVPGQQYNVQGGNLQQRLDYSGAPALPGVNDFSADRDAVTNAMLARSEPQFARDEELTRTRLMNQGIAAGSEASNYDLDTLNRARNDARNQAIMAGGQEQSRLFGLASQARGQYTGEQQQQGNFANQVAQQQFQQGLANANLTNDQRQQAIQEQAYLRSLPLNELNALRTGAQVTNPQFQGFNSTTIGQTPIFGAAQAQGQSDQNLYNVQQGAVNSFNSGLANIGGMAAMRFSDRRLKSNIERIGAHPLGIGIYEYDIFGHRERGVMADEVFHVKPEAVMTHPSGYMMVNYGDL